MTLLSEIIKDSSMSGPGGDTGKTKRFTPAFLRGYSKTTRVLKQAQIAVTAF
jgi:hypothetical protein